MSFWHLKPQRCTVHFLSCSYTVWDGCFLSVCAAFLKRSAAFCLFIITNSQPGFIVCAALFGRWKSFFSKLSSGVYVETSNALQLFHPPPLQYKSLAYSSCVHYSCEGYYEGRMMVILFLFESWSTVLWNEGWLELTEKWETRSKKKIIFPDEGFRLFLKSCVLKQSRAAAELAF